MDKLGAFMNKRLALLILIFTFFSTANTSMAQNLGDVHDKKTTDRFDVEAHFKDFENLGRPEDYGEEKEKEKLELMNKVLTQGEIINQGYTKSEHSFVVIYRRKLYYCHIGYNRGGCLEIEKPIF